MPGLPQRRTRKGNARLMQSLTPPERETILNWSDEEKTAQRPVITKLKAQPSRRTRRRRVHRHNGMGPSSVSRRISSHFGRKSASASRPPQKFSPRGPKPCRRPTLLDNATPRSQTRFGSRRRRKPLGRHRTTRQYWWRSRRMSLKPPRYG
jgi:hypothetical protein